jgi:hypothetical protein
MTAPTSAPPAARGTAELASIADLGEDARALLEKGAPGPRAYVAQLQEKELHIDAVKFIAHALPRREAVWWAWVCARKSAGDSPKPPIKAALEATERWIVQPSEDHRRAALQFGEAADFGTPAGCAALAAFMTSGSLGPPTAPPIPPTEFMTAKAVSGSVILSAVSVEPEKAPAKFGDFVKLGLEVADRIKLWNDGVPS